MGDVKAQVRHLAMRKALTNVLSDSPAQCEKELDEFVRIFNEPADAFGYLRALGFDVSVGVWPFNPLPRMARRLGHPSDEFHSLRPYLMLAVAAEGYPPAELRQWLCHHDLLACSKPRFSSHSFRTLARMGVPGAYAGVLAQSGLGFRGIVDAWRAGVPIEFAAAAAHV